MVLWVTFLITVIFDLTMAIQIGVVLSIFLFMRRMAAVTNVRVVTDELEDDNEDAEKDTNTKQIPKGVEIYEINGPFFFGASYKFMEAMKSTGRMPKIRIIQMRNVLSLDATGLNALREQHKNSLRHGIPFIISGIHTQPLVVLQQSGLLETIGEENIFRNLDDALNRSRELLKDKKQSAKKR